MTNIAVRQVVESLNPIDSLMFRKIAEDRNCCEEILKTILGDQALSVDGMASPIKEGPIPEATVTNLQGRSGILDVYCTLGNGRKINIEVQRSPNEKARDAFQKRVRYYASLITANITEPGTEFENIPELCVIYIADFDPFGSGVCCYHIDRIIRETGVRKYNGLSEIYVNARSREDSPTARLMRVFIEPDVYDNEEFPYTSARKWLFKTTPKGRDDMSELLERYVREYAEEYAKEVAEQAASIALEQGMQQGMQQGIEQGIDKGRLLTMQLLVSDGTLTPAVAAAKLGIDEETFLASMQPVEAEETVPAAG